MGNNLPLTAAIKKEMGDDTTVKTKCGMPFTVSAEVDGKTGNRDKAAILAAAQDSSDPLALERARQTEG